MKKKRWAKANFSLWKSEYKMHKDILRVLDNLSALPHPFLYLYALNVKTNQLHSSYVTFSVSN